MPEFLIEFINNQNEKIIFNLIYLCRMIINHFHSLKKKFYNAKNFKLKH